MEQFYGKTFKIAIEKTHPQPLSFKKRGEQSDSPSLAKRRGRGMSFGLLTDLAT
jgi:hypothetical protein